MSKPFPDNFDFLFGGIAAAIVICWVVYKIDKCIKNRVCAKMRQILPIQFDDGAEEVIDVPRVTFQVDAEVATVYSEYESDDIIYVEAHKNNIIEIPKFVSIIEQIESDIQPLTFAVQVT